MADGVPPLLDASTQPTPQPLLTADSPAIQPTSRIPAWGIYKDGVLAIQADSILKVEYKASARIATAPQEDGSFQAYDKVQAPYECRVTMTKGGNESERAAFLVDLETNKQSTALFDVVMPERSYQNANIVAYSFGREARQGVTLLRVEIVFEEVRQAAAPQFTTSTGGAAAPVTSTPIPAPKNPTGADPVNAGTKQPVPPTPAQSAPIRKALAPATAAGGVTPGG